MRVNSTSDIVGNSITGTVELDPNNYVEVWCERLWEIIILNKSIFIKPKHSIKVLFAPRVLITPLILIDVEIWGE